MPDYPSVSVAMATYNGERYLEEQLDSILSQSLRPEEIVVCDDQSTDGTRAILEKYQKRGQISFFVNDNRLGFVGNFKRAVSLTNPKSYVALSDQDDIWLPAKIENSMRLMLNTESKQVPAMTYSDLILVDENKNVLNPSFRNELGQDVYEHCLKTLLFGGFVNGCTMLMNPLMRSYFSSIPEKTGINHDTWIALIAFTFGRVGMVEPSDILYRKHLNNATEVNDFKRRGRFQRLKTELLNAFLRNDLFEKEISTAEEFYNFFQKNLSNQDKLLIEKFNRLHGKSYLRKKIALRSFFMGKWN